MTAVVAIAALVVPGLGHALQARYVRGLLWLVLAFAGLWSIPLTMYGLVIALAAWLGSPIDAVIAYRKYGRLDANRWPIPLAWALGGLALVFATRIVVIEAFKIPASSMTPTLVVGDHVFISKLAKSPSRGDVIVFRQPCDPRKDYVKRVVGIAGDRIEMRCGTLYVNGQAAPRKPIAGPCTYDDFYEDGEGWVTRSCTQVTETLDGKTYTVLAESSTDHDFPTTDAMPSCDQAAAPVAIPSGSCEPSKAMIVPSDSLFVLGDNRPNSNDSRYWGVVPVGNVKGRVVGIWRSPGPNGERWSRFGGVR